MNGEKGLPPTEKPGKYAYFSRTNVFLQLSQHVTVGYIKESYISNIDM